jgi:WhiB family redox-sensing transcriptional regulator
MQQSQLAKQDDWKNRAACRKGGGFDGVDFHPTDASERSRKWDLAKAVCLGACPVRTECLQRAMEDRDDWAVMGGTTPHERREMRRQTRRRPIAGLGLKVST